MNTYTIMVTVRTDADSQEEAFRTIRGALDNAKLAQVITDDIEVVEVAIDGANDEEDERDEREMDAWDEAYERAASRYYGEGRDWR